MRRPLQPLEPLQKTQLQPPFGPSVGSLCYPCITTTRLSYSVLSNFGHCLVRHYWYLCMIYIHTYEKGGTKARPLLALSRTHERVWNGTLSPLFGSIFCSLSVGSRKSVIRQGIPVAFGKKTPGQMIPHNIPPLLHTWLCSSPLTSPLANLFHAPLESQYPSLGRFHPSVHLPLSRYRYLPIVLQSLISVPIAPRDDKGRLPSFPCSLSSSPIPLQRTKKVAYSLVFVIFPWPALLLCPAMSRCPFVPIIQLGALVCFDLLSSASFSSLNFFLLLFSSLLSLTLPTSGASSVHITKGSLTSKLPLPTSASSSVHVVGSLWKLDFQTSFDYIADICLCVCDNIDKLSYSDPRCSSDDSRPSIDAIYA